MQELFREYATSSQHLKTEHDMHRKQAELEDRIQQRLKEAEREREMEARKVMLDLAIDNKLVELVSSIRGRKGERNGSQKGIASFSYL